MAALGSVFLNYMKSLPEQVFEAFLQGYFTAKTQFSAIGIDPAHEQQNKMVKVVGGAIGLLDNCRALLEWALYGPYIAKNLTTRTLLRIKRIQIHMRSISAPNTSC